MIEAWIAVRDAIDWNTLTAYPAFAIGLFTMFGMVRYLRKPGLIGYLFRAGFWGFGAYHWRMGYWDIVRQHLLEIGAWEPLTDFLGGTTINVFWNVTAIYAAYAFMMAMHLAHPNSIRESRPWFLSPVFRLTESARRIPVVNRCLRRLIWKQGRGQ